jgi:hypothetical protein
VGLAVLLLATGRPASGQLVGGVRETQGRGAYDSARFAEGADPLRQNDETARAPGTEAGRTQSEGVSDGVDQTLSWIVSGGVVVVAIAVGLIVLSMAIRFYVTRVSASDLQRVAMSDPWVRAHIGHTGGPSADPFAPRPAEESDSEAKKAVI